MSYRKDFDSIFMNVADARKGRMTIRVQTGKEIHLIKERRMEN